MGLTEYLFLIFFLIIFAVAGVIAYLLSPSYVKLSIALGATAFFILLLAVTGLMKKPQ